MKWFMVFVAGYLIGSVSPSYFLGRFVLGKDLRHEGSGNLGAKNSWDIGGFTFGLSVFLLDLVKGAGVMLWIRSIDTDPLWLYWGMVSVVLGHNYSLFLQFRGGKGLAAVVGMLTVVQPLALLILIGLAGLLALLIRHAGAAAILTVIPYTVIFGMVSGDWRSWPFSLALSGLVLSKHRPDEYASLAAFFHGHRV